MCGAGVCEATKQGHRDSVEGPKGAHRQAGDLLTPILHHQAGAGGEAAAQPARIRAEHALGGFCERF